MRNADRLLELMESEAQRLIHKEKLEAILQWTESMTDRSSDCFKSATKRSVALFYALNCDLNLALHLTRDHDLVLVLHRAVYLDLDLALDLDLNYHDIALNCALDLDHTQIFTSVDFQALIEQLRAMRSAVPANDDPIEVRRSFAHRIRQSWYTALHLDPEWLKLSEEEKHSLNNYLYANELIIRCKEAALRVSPQVWNAIESRMLTVQN
jgi:hypothetical protein